MKIKRGFYIQCDNCMNNHDIKDGDIVKDEISFRVVGDNQIEVKCLQCNSNIVVRDEPIE